MKMFSRLSSASRFSRKILLQLGLLGALILGSSCGGNTSFNDIVKGIDVAVNNQEGDLVVSVGSYLYLKNILLPTIDLPIFNPSNSARPYGRIKIIAPLDYNGVHKIGFDLNLSAIAPIPPVATATLPNGHELPFTGVDNNKVIMLKINSIKSTFYFSISKTITFVGYAIVISQFDTIGNQAGAMDIFPVFQFANLVGAAGFFSSTASEQGGLAFFLNLSGVLTIEMLNKLMSGQKMLYIDKKATTRKLTTNEVDQMKKMFAPRRPVSEAKTQELMKSLNEMTSQKQRVNFVEE